MDLVAPPGEVAERVYGHADVRLERERVHGAGVERLERRQLLARRVHLVGESVHERAAVPRVHAPPLALVQRALGTEARAD